MLTIGFVKHAPHYRYARGKGLSYWTLEYFSAGEVVVRTPQGCHEYRTPSALLVPPHTPYTESAGKSGRWTEHYVVFDPLPAWRTLLDWPRSECGLGLLHLSDSTIAREVKAALQSALRIQHSARVNRPLLVANALEKVLLMLDEVNPARGRAHRDARIAQALEYIAAQYSRPLTLDALAQCVYLSPSHFAHLFKAQMKQSPMEYVEQYRLERAVERLLAGGDSVEQIAAAVGFSNAPHFATRFRRRFGQSPSRYRRNPGTA
jgi:AraC family transcriptional regulator of arabinose operon